MFKAIAALVIALSLFVYAFYEFLVLAEDTYLATTYSAQPMPSSSVQSPCLEGSWVLWRSTGCQLI